METALIEAIHALNYLIEENRKLQREKLELTKKLEVKRQDAYLTASVPTPGTGGAANV